MKKRLVKNVLVTGGTRGIGRAIAFAFAERNYNVAITGLTDHKEALNTLKVLSEKGSDSRLFYSDFMLNGAIEKLFEDFDTHYDHLDVFVNNAGWTKYIPHENLDELTEDIFDRIININLKSVFYCAVQAAKRMEGRNNCIINISSIAAFNGNGSNIAYCAAKAGVVSITKSLARVLGNRIRVNSVAPGLTETDMTKIGPEEYRLGEINITPMGRIASPEDVADAVISITENTKFINGQTIIVDGGRFLQ